MRRTRPLDDHPEFSVIDHPAWREFRVETSSADKLALRHFWLDACIVLSGAYLWQSVRGQDVFRCRFLYLNPATFQHIFSGALTTAVLVSGLFYYMYSRCTQILWGW